MSKQVAQNTNFDLDEQIKIAKEMLNEENVPLTKLASFVEEFARQLSEKYPKMMEIAMSSGASAPASPQVATEHTEDAEPTSFDIVIISIGPEKLKLIKEVRAISGLGLKESKDVIDKVASDGKSVVKSSVDKKEAEEVKAKLEELGAKVDLVGV